jgi:electron transfer flavoprotein beta subunit
MKAMVAVKRVLDYNIKVKFKADGSEVDLDNLKMGMNPFDEIAVEEAVRLKEAGIVTDIVVVSCGDAACAETLRTALAIGADSAIHIKTPHALQPLAVAKTLVEVAKRINPNLVIFGKQAIDDDSNQTGQMFAALSNMPQATFASKVELDGPVLKVTREIDGGLQTLKLQTPCVITADLRLNEPRYVSLPNLMKAKKKELLTWPLEELNVDVLHRLRVISVSPPPVRSAGVILQSVEELHQKLIETGLLGTLSTNH